MVIPVFGVTVGFNIFDTSTFSPSFVTFKVKFCDVAPANIPSTFNVKLLVIYGTPPAIYGGLSSPVPGINSISLNSIFIFVTETVACH